MRRDQLEHAIRAVSDLTATRAMIIIGSQAILGQFPDAPESLRQSIEIDIIPIEDPSATDRISGVMGELSQFHATHGFYVDAVRLETARLPSGWRERLFAVQGPNTRFAVGHCLDVGDIAASKLMAFREKDRSYVRVLLVHRLVDGALLLERLATVEASEEERAHRLRWVRAIMGEIASMARLE